MNLMVTVMMEMTKVMSQGEGVLVLPTNNAGDPAGDNWLEQKISGRVSYMLQKVAINSSHVE